MLLNEIKPVLSKDVDLKEGVIPVHLTMLLQQVVKDGGITNNVQYFVIAGLVEMFKNGSGSRWPRDLNSYDMSTNAELIEAVKSLSPQDAVALAVWLEGALRVPANYENKSCCYYQPQLDTVSWVKYVLNKQD